MRSGDDRFWYLATVFTKHPEGPAAAVYDAARYAAQFVEAGVKVYAPIAYTYQLVLGDLRRLHDHEFWMAFDAPFMAAAGGLIVALMPHWNESDGIRQEIQAFTDAEKPIVYWQPDATIPKGVFAL